MTASITLAVKAIQTAPLKITVAIPPENPQIKGYFTGHAIIRSKAENKELLDKFVDYDGTGDADEELLRAVYDKFTGLGNEAGEPLEGDAAWEAVINGPLSAYLMPAAIQAYYEQYGEARRGNSGKRRSR